MSHALTITGISSMATRALLADLARAWEQRSGCAVAIESVGGVDAARRVQDGEAFDAVFLAADAIDKLVAAGRVVAGSRVDLVRSGVAVAVRSGAERPDIGSEDALRQAVLQARSVGISTGPSGVQLASLFERWGVAEAIRDRLVTAPAGVPVAALVARGKVELGLQQLSELIGVEGVEVVGPLPGAVQIVTTFSAGLCTASTHPEAVRAMFAFMASPEVAPIKQLHGMESAVS